MEEVRRVFQSELATTTLENNLFFETSKQNKSTPLPATLIQKPITPKQWKVVKDTPLPTSTTSKLVIQAPTSTQKDVRIATFFKSLFKK
jgi:hypothetical protein